MLNRPGGAGVGIAKGRIEIDLTQFQQSKQVVVRASQEMRVALEGAGASGKKSTDQITESLTQLQKTMQQTRAVAAAAFAAIAVGGVAAAARVQRLDALFNALTGSEERATKALDDLRELADRTSQPFLAMAEGATSLLPAIGRTNVDLAQTVALAQRLAILDPVQGVQGAAIAIRELLGGEIRSLAFRFEIPRAQLNELLERAGGDPQAIIDGLSEMVDQMGLTEKSLEEMGRAGVGAFGMIRDEVQQTLAEFGRPLLNEFVLPLIRGFRDLLRAVRDLNPDLLRLASIGGTLAAAGTLAGRVPFGIGAAAGPRVQRVAGVGAAGFIGAEAGIGVARGLARLGIGDQRLATASQAEAREILGERIKQIVVIFAAAIEQGATWVGDRIAELSGTIQLGSVIVRNVLENSGEALRLGLDLLVESIKNGAGQLLAAIGGIILSLADLLDSIPGVSGGALRGPGEGLQAEGQRLQSEAQTRMQAIMQTMAQTFGPTADELAVINAEVEHMKGNIRDMTGGLAESVYDFLFGAEEVEEAVNPLADAIAGIVGGLNRLVSNRQRARDIEQEILAELAEEQGRIDEDRARNALRDEEDFARRRLQNLTDFLRGQAQAETDFYRRRAEQIADFAEDQADVLQDFERDRLQQMVEFNRSEARNLEDHQLRLEQIRSSGQEAIRDAASRLDARGVAEALRSSQTRLRNEQSSFERERERRREDFELRLQEQAENFAEQRSERLAAFEEQLRDQERHFRESQQRQQEDFQRRLQREDQERAIRLQRMAEDFAREDALRRQEAQKRINDALQEAGLQRRTIQTMLTNWRSGLTSAAQSATQFVNAVRTAFNNLNTTRSTVPVNTGINVPGVRGNTGPTISAFQHGGRPPLFRDFLVGDDGPEILRIAQPGVVFPADTSRQMLASGGGRSFALENLNITIGDIGDRSDFEVKRIVVDALNEFVQEFENAGGRVPR